MGAGCDGTAGEDDECMAYAAPHLCSRLPLPVRHQKHPQQGGLIPRLPPPFAAPHVLVMLINFDQVGVGVERTVKVKCGWKD